MLNQAFTYTAFKLFQYSVAKVIYYSFSDHFEIAKSEPIIDYDPLMRSVTDDKKPMERLRNPAKYVNRGMYIRRIEKLAVALLDEQSQNDENLLIRCVSHHLKRINH